MNTSEYQSLDPEPTFPSRPDRHDHPWSGWRRMAAAAVLGATLLAGAGVAAVNAASPAPTTSGSAPLATTAPGGTTTPGAAGTHSCP